MLQNKSVYGLDVEGWNNTVYSGYLWIPKLAKVQVIWSKDVEFIQVTIHAFFIRMVFFSLSLQYFWLSSHFWVICDLPYPYFMCLKWLSRSWDSFGIHWHHQKLLFLHFWKIFSWNLSLSILIECILIKRKACNGFKHHWKICRKTHFKTQEHKN